MKQNQKFPSSQVIFPSSRPLSGLSRASADWLLPCPSWLRMCRYHSQTGLAIHGYADTCQIYINSHSLEQTADRLVAEKRRLSDVRRPPEEPLGRPIDLHGSFILKECSQTMYEFRPQSYEHMGVLAGMSRGRFSNGLPFSSTASPQLIPINAHDLCKSRL